MRTQRLEYIDELKGLAILLVVMGHIMEFCLYSGKTSFLHDAIYSFHMPLFAFLSGLVFTSLIDGKKIWNKVQKQSFRLLVPFLTMGLFYSHTLFQGESFWFQPFKQGLWYLWFLWQSYLITHIYNLLILKYIENKTKVCVVFDVCWIIMIYVFMRFTMGFCQIDINNIVGSLHLMKLYPFFFIGVMLNRYKLPPHIWKSSKWLPDLSLIIWIVLLLEIKLIPNNYLYKLSYIIEISALYPIVFYFAKFGNSYGKVQKMLGIFGRYSLEIYMFHRFMTDTCDLHFVGDYIHCTESYAIESLIVIPLSILMSYVSVCLGKILEKMQLCSVLILGKRYK